jgi:RNA polymerase sigma factor (sigma-70 family)
MRPCAAHIDSPVAGPDPMSCSHCPAEPAESAAVRGDPRAVADRELRRRFRDGDGEAVRSIYRAHGRAVFSVAYRILRDRGLAEDATQQAFLNAWRAAHSFDTRRDFGPWLAMIARRAAIDVYRRESTRAAGSLESLAPSDPALSVEPATAALHDVWEIRRAVEALPENEREVVRMQHFEELTHPEIADRLGIAVGTVKSRSFRAHQRLATMTMG